MLHVYNHIDKLLRVKSFGRDFKMQIELLKSMPIRYYEKEYGWLIPITDFPLLINKINNTPIQVKIQKGVRDTYKKHRKSVRQRLKIKTLSNTHICKNMDNLNIDLYPFQTIGAYFIYKSGNAILGDVVGLGKTATALSAVERLFNERQINSTIVLCPPTLKRNWENEILKFTDRISSVVMGTKAQRKKIYKNAYKTDFLIIPYNTLLIDFDDLITTYILEKNFHFSLIMDEIQYVKNSSAQRTKFTRKLAKVSKFKIGLSATTIENGIMDLYNVFQVIDTTPFGDGRLYKHFQNRYCEFNYWGDVVSVKNAKTIIKRMAPFFLRRFKEDVLTQLPERIENNLWIPLSSVQRKIYNDIKAKIIEEIADPEKSDKIKRATVLTMMGYLRQCCLSAKLVGVSDNISTKTDVLMDFLQSLDSKSKVVIFSHFKLMVTLLEESLNKAKYKIMKITAKIKPDDRIDLIKIFNESDDLKILLTGDVLEIGVNIPSANYVINFDLLFNPFTMEQRAGRIDRLDTKHSVLNIVNLITENTVEEHIWNEILVPKMALSKEIIDEGRVEKRLTLKNLRSLI